MTPSTQRSNNVDGIQRDIVVSACFERALLIRVFGKQVVGAVQDVQVTDRGKDCLMQIDY